MAEAEIAHTNQSTRTLLLGIWGHLSRRRRIQLGLLLVVMLASGGAELVSLGAVLPFLAVLSDPERLWQQPLVQALAGRLADQRRVAVGSDLSCEAYRRTLYQPYGVHVQRNSAAVLPFLAVVSASTSTDQAADRRGFPLSLQVHKPGGWFVPLIPCSA